MAQAISVRLDDDADRALRVLQASGLSRSEAIRSSLIAAAAKLRTKESIRAEVAAAEADPVDRAEMQAIAEFMESIRAPW